MNMQVNVYNKGIKGSYVTYAYACTLQRDKGIKGSYATYAYASAHATALYNSRHVTSLSHLMIFEVIVANGREPPPPFIIIQGKYIMVDWFPPEFEGGSWIETLESGFTNNVIALKWLNHFI
jgi:hypothetical protein